MKISKNNSTLIFALVLLECALFQTSCNKFLDINNVTDNIYADQVFENQGTANLAIAGIYKQLQSPTLVYATMLYNSSYSGDIQKFNPNGSFSQYVRSQLLPTESTLPWNSYYSIIYSCNSAIEGLSKSTSVPNMAKNYYISEARFLRALSYFYLVNLFGDVPLVTTTSIQDNSLIAKASIDEIYEQIIDDLKYASSNMTGDYAFTGGEKTRANNWVALSFLARIYLYRNDFENAEKTADQIITTGPFSLLSSPTGIFQKNNSEAILQLANSATESNIVATNFIFNSTPNFIVTPFLLNAFEPNDLRKETWISSKIYAANGTRYFFPFKFTSTASPTNEYFTLIRLSEMYLIRAEARAMRENFLGCVTDLNVIRLKHGGLSSQLPAPSSQQQALVLTLHERQVELFTEGMHRFFDLKRTGKLQSTMSLEKPSTWKSTAELYPIPLSEIQRNTKLIQNTGYN